MTGIKVPRRGRGRDIGQRKKRRMSSSKQDEMWERMMADRFGSRPKSPL